MPGKLYATKDVAQMLELSVPAVNKWRRELGVGQLVGSGYVYTEEDVERIRARPGARSKYRPRKGNTPEPKPEGV